MKTITFYSYKGGVGRSLALSNIAIRLSELKKKVCVLDFDLEAPGLQFKFNNYSQTKQIEKGIVDYIDEFTSNGTIPKTIKDFSVELLPANSFFEKIQLIPAGNIDDNSYWRKLSCISWKTMFYEEESKGIQFFLDLKHKIEKELQPDFLLIDSRTGITDIAGITLKLLADEAVILAANNRENLYGSKKIIKSLIDKNNLLLESIPKITFLLTRLPYSNEPQEKQKEMRIIQDVSIEIQQIIPSLEVLVIHSDRRLEISERPLIGDDYEKTNISISNDYLRLFDKLTNDVLSKEEVLIFKNKRNAEKEFAKGMEESDTAKKIIYFNNAIDFDSTQFQYFLQRGIAFQSLEDFRNAEKNYLKALSLNEDSIETLGSIATLYANNKNFVKALYYLEISLKKDNYNWYSYFLKAWVCQKEEKHLEALAILDYAILNISQNIPYLWNSRADLFRLLKKYDNAYTDIYRAIEIDPQNSLFFATLAEINASEGKWNEFYLYLNIAFSMGIKIKALSSAKEVYEKVKDDARFISLMAKYAIDINEILEEPIQTN